MGGVINSILALDLTMVDEALQDSLYEKFTGNGQNLESAIFSYITADTSVFLEGANKKFFAEHDYQRGLEILYSIPYHPIVSGSFLKLIQEVTGLNSQVIPAETGSRVKAATHAKYLEEHFKEIGISDYYQDLLLAQITGLVAHELIWGKDFAKKPELKKLQAIPPEYIWPTARGVQFRKSVNSHELVPQTPNKFSLFTYSMFLNLSPLGDGVGKVLYYLLKQREKIECLASIFALRGATPTTVLQVTGEVKTTVVKSIISDLNRNDSWKNVALPPNVDLKNLTNTSAKYDIYNMLLNQNQALITDQLAGESIVGADSTTGQRGAQEASNLRKTRAIRLGLKAVEHINQKIAKPVIDYKFGTQQRYPTFFLNMPQLNKLGLATIQDAIAVQLQLGLQVNPAWFEKNYALDIQAVGADL